MQMNLSRKKRWLVGLVAVIGMALFAVRVWNARITPEKLAAGRELFEREWQVDDGVAHGDGLGPVFNAKSCVECHFQGSVGGGGENRQNVTAFQVLPGGDRQGVLAGVVHKFAVADHLVETRARVNELFPPIPNGLTIETKKETKTADLDPVLFEEINTPPLFGLGLIDRMPDWAIQMNGIGRTATKVATERGKPTDSAPVGRLRTHHGNIGKFGWRAQFASLEAFVATACAVELGLSNPRRRQDIPREHAEDQDAPLDIDSQQLHQLVSFVASLPAPREVLPTDPSARERALHGKELFSEIGCSDCHTPSIGGVDGVYSDFHLYTLEADKYESQDASGVEMPRNHPQPSEWKTPPLWGVADSAPYFHDGRSKTLHDAIMRHGVNARRSRQRYEKLWDQDRDAVVAFLKTLRAPIIPPRKDLAAADK